MTPADVAQVRQRLVLSQAELATLLGVHKQTVFLWEKGQLAPNPFHEQLLAVFANAARRSPRAGRQALNVSRGGVPQALFLLLCVGLPYVPCTACAGRGCPPCEGYGFVPKPGPDPAALPVAVAGRNPSAGSIPRREQPPQPRPQRG